MGELRLPQARCEIDDILRRMLAHALQDIDQVGVDIDAVEFAGRDQALDDADLLGPELGPAKKPIVAVIESFL